MITIHKYCYFLLVFLCACLSGEPEEIRSRMRWADNQMIRFIADESMPMDCIIATDESIQFYISKNVKRISLEYSEPSFLGFFGIVPKGTVSIHYTKDLGFDEFGNKKLGVTHRERLNTSLSFCMTECIEYNPLLSAEIEIAECDFNTIAHEIGHSLGLEHVNDINNLMYWSDEINNNSLTKEQIDWIK